MKGLISEIPMLDDVFTLDENDTVQQALYLFIKHNIGSVVIVDENRMVKGIFTERDYIKKITGNEASLIGKPLKDFMTPNPKSVNESDQIMKAVISMRLGRFRHIVVKNADHTLKGVISVKDLLDWYVDENK